MNYRDEKLFAGLARAAERRLRRLDAQDLSNIAWSFVKASNSETQLFRALKRVAE